MEWNLILKDMWIFVLIPVLRSGAGWLQNSLKDNKIDKFEWQKLLETVLTVGLTGLLIYVGLDEMGFEVPAVVSGIVAYLMDLILRAWKYPEQRIVKRTEVTQISRVVKK